MEVLQEIKDHFIQLHNHSQFSVRDALSKLEDLVDRVKLTNNKYLSITDHGNVAVWAKMYKMCKQNNIIPIFGCQLYVNDYRELDKTDPRFKKYFHLIALAVTQQGVKNLILINNDAHINGFYYKPRTCFQTLCKFKQGIVFTTACISGQAASYIINDNLDLAKETLKKYKNAFGDKFYIELQLHNMQDQVKANIQLIKLAKELNIKTILTNDCHYINKDDTQIHDMLIAIRNRSTGNDQKRQINEIDFSGYEARQLYYKTYDQMYQSWKLYHKSSIFTQQIFIQSCNNIQQILNLVQTDITFDSQIKLPIMAQNEQQIFTKKILVGLSNRYKEEQITDEIINRVKYQYAIIRKMNYIGYFLIIQQIVNGVHKLDISTGFGRGSIAGCLIAYLLGITQVDPIKYDLMFERFLDLGRDRVKFYKLI